MLMTKLFADWSKMWHVSLWYSYLRNLSIPPHPSLVYGLLQIAETDVVQDVPPSEWDLLLGNKTEQVSSQPRLRVRLGKRQRLPPVLTFKLTAMWSNTQVSSHMLKVGPHVDRDLWPPLLWHGPSLSRKVWPLAFWNNSPLRASG